MCASHKLAALLTAVLLLAGACSTATSTGPSRSTQPTTLSASPTPAATPFAMKDGEPWIVYSWLQECDADGCDKQGIYLVRPDGRDKHLPLTTSAGQADWSPDGRRLAVSTEPTADVPGEVWTLDADGTDAAVISCDGAPCGSSSWPAWSPDGKELAFERGIPRAAGEYHDRGSISVIDLATGATRIVAMPPVAGSEYTEYIGPRWSPDGTQIVFTVMRYPVPPTDENILSSSIAVVNADGSEADTPRILTDPAMFGAYPDWSPDGERIVFHTYPIGSFQDTTKATNLYTIRPDGTGLTQVTHFGENDTRAIEPTWTPDGERIIFVHITRNPNDPWGDRHIGFIDADGSNLSVVDWFGTHPRLRPTP